MGRDPGRKRGETPSRTPLVGPADRRLEHARVDVVLVTPRARPAREERALRCGAGQRRAPGDKLVAQQRREVDLADSRLRLGVLDADVAVREVDVFDVQAAELRVSESGAREAGD